MKTDKSYFASDGYSPGLSGLSGYSPGDRQLYNDGKPYMIGDDVKFVQAIVGAEPDGAYGPNTQAAVEQWQRQNGTTPTGIVNTETWQLLKKKKSGGSILSQAWQDTFNWFTGNVKQLDNPWDQYTSALLNQPQSDDADTTKESNNHLLWWIGGGAVGISLLGLALAGNDS